MNYRFDITINLDEIQQAIYTEGTWHPAENATAWGVNQSNEPILDRRVREGLDDLLTRMSGYIVSRNINFNLESQNIVLGIEVKKRPLLTLANDLKSAIISALANYTLMSLYGDEDSIYGTAWPAPSCCCVAPDNSHCSVCRSAKKVLPLPKLTVINH